MFTVGEFSKIAQVSKRLLRYYDQIELFTPAHIDASNGRRYYTADQMPTLNRILALKDLGLTLEQIQRLLQDEVSTDEMQGMLLLKKAEIEVQLQEELQRIRRIESRLHAIRDAEADRPLNVVIKSMDTQPVLSTHVLAATFETGLHTMRRIRAKLPEGKRYGLCFLICQEEFVDDVECVDTDDMHLEIGCFVEADTHAIVPLSDTLRLEYRQLPAVEMMACSVVEGPLEYILNGYLQVGKWAADNGYRTVGMPREITLKLPQKPDASDMITEVRFAVEPITQV